LWESIPIIYGNLFPLNRESFPTICGKIGTSLSSTGRKGRRRSYLTMRNTLKYYENKVDFEPKYGETYEKCRFEKVFLIRYLFDYLLFI
jgi:hypothetical protein